MIVDFKYNDYDCIWKQNEDGSGGVVCVNCGLKFFKPVHAICKNKISDVQNSDFQNLAESISPNQFGKGPGTELKKLFIELGINRPSCLSCGNLANQMDKWGPDGCQENKQIIVDKLSEEKDKCTWIEKLKVASHGFLTVESLIDEAIRRAEENKRNEETNKEATS